MKSNLQLKRKMTQGVYVGVAAVVLSLFAGCNNDPNTTKMQYVPDMADGPVVKVQRDFLAPPEGAVAMNAILYPATIEESEKVLKNPFPAGPDVEARGKVLYDTFCIPCHGADAKGQGSITDLFPPPPDISAATYLTRGDGFFFHKITFGGPIMPSLGHSISAHERWQIVHYLRTIQRQTQGEAPK